METFIDNFNNEGPLYIDKIIVYYDEPQLFTLHDNCHNNFLGLLTDEDSWLIMKVSCERLCDILESTISIKDSFKYPELKCLYEFKFNNNHFNISQKKPTEILDIDLPDDDIYVNSLTSEIFTKEEINWNHKRDSLSLRIIDDKQPDNHEISCSILANILTTIQNIFNNQAKCKYKHSYKNSEIIDKSKLCVSGTFMGSFGIKLKTQETRDLLEETSLSPIFEDFLEMQDLSSTEAFKQFFDSHNYDYRVLNYYKNYLNLFLKHGLNIEYISNIRNKSYNKFVNLIDTRKNYEFLSNYVRNKTFISDFDGILVSADVSSKQFKLETEEKLIKGTIDKELLNKNFVINDKYTLTLEITQEQNEITGTLEEKFKMVNYQSKK